MSESTKLFGAQGEDLVCQWLQKNNFVIITRNYQTRCGEVDIIAAKDEVVAFVEVKTRHIEYFPVSQVVTWRKQQRVIKTARYFIVAKGLRDKVFRFDVATVVWNGDDYQIEYIPNAFGVR